MQIRQWLGDSRGRWEAPTLVVETLNFTDKTNYYGSREHLRLVERFTRVAPDMIIYRVTIDDATTFTRPWTIEVPLTRSDEKRNQIFENACHEGNYALTNILAGARAFDKTEGCAAAQVSWGAMAANNPRISGCSRRGAIGRLGAILGSPFAMLWTGQVLGAQSAPPWLAARSARPATFPKGAIIRTILADLPPDRLGDGATMFHEHLTGNYSSPPAARGAAPQGGQPGDTRFVDLMVEEMRSTRFDGVHCIVDSALRRRPAQNVDQMRQIAQRSGMHVVLGGGYYLAPYPQEVAAMSEDQLADQFTQDAATQRWGAFGEIGTSLETHPDERKVMRAISKAHVRTGLPIFTHSPHESCPKCALEQLDIYQKNGVAVSSLCIGHLSAIKLEDDPRGDTLKEVAKRGAFIGFDTVGHEMTRSHIPEAQKIKMFRMMLDAGYEDHLLLSGDFAQANNIKANWGNGWSSVVLQFVPKLRFAGVKDETLHKILVDNPRRFLAFVPKGA